MDLREYIKIIQKDLKIFLVIILSIVIAVLAYFYFQPVSYRASLTLNVTRSGIQETQDYRYDGFYRLQADERFAETLSEWFRSPRVVSDIFSRAKISSDKFSLEYLSKNISAQKRSSQIVEVTFSSISQEQAEKIASAGVEIVSQMTEKLNAEQNEKNWFKIIAEKPVISKYVPSYKTIFIAAFLAGIFLAFWVVMFRHYFRK